MPNAESMSADNAIVSSGAMISRAFQKGLRSFTWYAKFKTVIELDMPAEADHNAPNTPTTTFHPPAALAVSVIVFWITPQASGGNALAA
jgi:hypothetical protein